MRQKKWFRRFGLLLVGLSLAYIPLCYFMAEMLISGSRNVPVRPKGLEVWEPVPHVPAWASPMVAVGAAKYLFVFSHGVQADRSFYETTAMELVHRGYDVILLPMPGHDENPEPYLGFGPKEAALIKATLDKVKAKKIVLVGCSLGGAATWLASDHPSVDGVVSESAFGRLKPITESWFDRVMPGGSMIFRPVNWIASSKLHLDPGDVNPVEVAAKWDRAKPALVIHAGADQLIPISDGRELARVSGAEFWEVPKLRHAQCQDIGLEYVDRIERVMQKAIRYGYSEEHAMPGGGPDNPPDAVEKRAMAALGTPIPNP